MRYLLGALALAIMGAMLTGMVLRRVTAPERRARQAQQQAQLQRDLHDALAFQERCGFAPHVDNEKVRHGVPSGSMFLAYPQQQLIVMFRKRHKDRPFSFDEVDFVDMPTQRMVSVNGALLRLGCAPRADN